MRAGRRATLLSVALCLGCYDGVPPVAVDSGSTGGVAPATADSESSDGGVAESSGGSAEEGARVVPQDLATQSVQTRCVEIDDGTPLGASPNGELWLARQAQAQATLESVGPDQAVRQWAVPSMPTALNPWTSTTATLSTVDGLFAFDDGTLRPVRWLEAQPSPTAFCGDPAVEGDGYLLAGDLFTRDVGQWWRWNMPGDALASDDRLGHVVGACSGTQDTTWLWRGGEVWSVSPEWIARRPDLSPSAGLAVDDSFGVASVVDDGLVVAGPSEEVTYVFDAGAVRFVASAPGRLWVAAGEQLYQMVDGEFVRVVGEVGEDVVADRIWPDAVGGAWLEDDASQTRCYAASPGPRVVLEGIREYERRRSTELSATLAVVGGSGEAPPEVTLDDQAVALVEVTAAQYEIGADDLSAGWHTLVVSVGGSVRRSVPLFVSRVASATWQDDIEPLFAEHCAGAGCHGPGPINGAQPDLSTHEAWLERPESIDARVVQIKDMPSLSSRKESWGVDDVLLVARWLEAGLPAKEDE